MIEKSVENLTLKNEEVLIISVNEVNARILKSNWKDPNQIITFLFKNELYVAIDNVEGIEHNIHQWKGKKYIEGEKVIVNTKVNSGFLWVEKTI